MVAQANEEELTPDPRAIARDEVKDYVKYSLYLELPPGIEHLDFVLPPLPEDRPVIDDDDAWHGAQAHNEGTCGIGGAALQALVTATAKAVTSSVPCRYVKAYTTDKR